MVREHDSRLRSNWPRCHEHGGTNRTRFESHNPRSRFDPSPTYISQLHPCGRCCAWQGTVFVVLKTRVCVCCVVRCLVSERVRVVFGCIRCSVFRQCFVVSSVRLGCCVVFGLRAWWWYIMMIHYEPLMRYHQDTSWWYMMMIYHHDDKSEWYRMIIYHGDVAWWYIMMIYHDDISSWYVIISTCHVSVLCLCLCSDVGMCVLVFVFGQRYVLFVPSSCWTFVRVRARVFVASPV